MLALARPGLSGWPSTRSVPDKELPAMGKGRVAPGPGLGALGLLHHQGREVRAHRTYLGDA